MTLLTPPPERIYLMRHARSGWALPGASDFDRTLSDAGFAEAELVATTAADRGYRPGVVVSSSAARCRQTTEAMRRAFGGAVELRFVDDLYNAPADSYVDTIAALSGFPSVMIVGHNPAIEELFVSLVGADVANRTIPEGYPTFGLAVLDHDGPEAEWLLRDFLIG